MASKPPATIYDILQLVPSQDKNNPTWVNDEFEGVVSNVKSGQKSTSCVVSDVHNPSVSITAVFWDKRDLSRFNGCVCHFAGQGMKRDAYQGTEQVSCSAKTTINVVGRATNQGAQNAGSGQPQGQQRQGNPAPASSSGTAIHGATVGMAINQANTIIIAQTREMKPEDREKFFDSPEYSRRLWTTASDIIRVSTLMEKGKLATAPKDRADPNFAAKQKEAAEAEKKRLEEEERKRIEAEKAANQGGQSQGNLDEDVPF